MKQNKLEKEQSALENNLKETLKNSKGKEVSLTGFFNVSYCNIIFILIELHAISLFLLQSVPSTTSEVFLKNANSSDDEDDEEGVEIGLNPNVDCTTSFQNDLMCY